MNKTKQRMIFSNVRYWINPYLPITLRKKLRTLLDANGGFPSEQKEEDDGKLINKFDLKNVTHIITATWDFLGYKELEQSKKKYRVCTPKWVFDCCKFNKHYSTKHYSPNPRNIFSGIIITCYELPLSDTEKIYGGVSALGGQYKTALTKEVTHLITMNYEEEKLKLAVEKCDGIQVVTPHWIEDCIKLRKLIPEENYSFPEPSIFREDFEVEKAFVKTAKKYLGIEEKDLTINKDSEWINNNYLKGISIYFDEELEIKEEFLKDIKNQLISYGAKICAEFNTKRVNCYICQFRNSKFYEQALKSDLIIGNITWIFHTILTKKFDSPSNQLLFYPTMAYPIPEMKNLVIAISKYDQGSREYLKRLINAVGATYTPYLNSKNTHLICSRLEGDKFQKAREWNINVVNHLWLEESYRSWTCQAVSNHQFSHYPFGLMLDSIIADSIYTPEDIYIKEDIIMEDLSQKSIPESEHNVSLISDDEIINDEDANFPSVLELLEENSKENIQEDVKKSKSDIKSKPRPSRKAAAFASQSLHKLMDAQNQFEKSVKNKLKKFSDPPPAIGGAIEANAILPPKIKSQEELTQKTQDHDNKEVAVKKRGRKPKNSNSLLTEIDNGKEDNVTSQGNNQLQEVTKKRKTKVNVDLSESSLMKATYKAKKEVGLKEENKNENENEVLENDLKDKKHTKTKKIKLLFTGTKPTVAEKKKIIQLGAEITESCSDFTHLISQSISRTVKFLCAINGGKPIVTINWIRDCIRKNKLLDDTKYYVVDKSAERKLGFNMKESLEKARKKQLFDGLEIACTPSVTPDIQNLEHIIKAGGGKFLSKFPTKKYIADKIDNKSKPELIILSCDEDKQYLLDRIDKEYLSKRKSIVFMPEVILSGSVTQRLEFKDKFKIVF